MCLLQVLCANEAADVSPHPLQDDQEGQQVEEQSDSLEKKTEGWTGETGGGRKMTTYIHEGGSDGEKKEEKVDKVRR